MKVSRITRPAIVLAAMSVLWLGLAPAIASAAVPGTAVSAGTGWIRLAHLSPNAPAVDVYLYSFGNPDAKLVLRHVGYGIVSPYEPVAAGDYSVAMRPADAPATTKPMLSAGVMVPGGDAYTVAGVGPYPGLRLQVIEDKLTTPPGRALVRVIQASLRQHQVTVSYAGQLLAARLPFASVSSYRALSPGTATVRVLGAGSRASTDVTLASGTVHTLVVLDGTGGLMIDPLQDAAGSAAVPAGGAATGFGGTAPHGAPSPVPWVAVITAGTLLALAGGGRLLRRSRPTSSRA